LTTRLRKPMLVLGTTILMMQAVFMPVGMVYAETTIDTEEQELVELPPMKTYLTEEPASEPRFFFTRSRMQGTTKEPVKVTFFSDQEVSEAQVSLPEEATLLINQLPTGVSVEKGEHPNEWIVQSERAQKTFVLPLVVQKAGNYELSVEESTAHLEISEEATVEETESSNEDLATEKDVREENVGYGISKNQLSDIPFPPPSEQGHADNPMDQFDRWVPLDSSGNIESGWENIPASIIYSANRNSSRTLLNGRPVSQAAGIESLGPVIASGDIITFENVGTGVDDKPFHARLEVFRTRNSIGTRNVMRLHSRGFNNRSGEGRADFSAITSFIYSDGTIVDGDILLSFDDSNSTIGGFYITLLNENIKAVLGQPNNQNGWGETDGISTTVKPGAPLNMIVPGAPHVQVFSRVTRNSIVLFEQHGPALDLDIFYSDLDIIGEVEEEEFVSQYKVSQRIPSSGNIDDGLDIQINNPDVLKTMDAEILSIKDDTGNDLSEVIKVSKAAGQVTFTINKEELSNLQGKTIDIELVYPIDKSKNPKDFLVGDYLEIELEVSNSLSNTVATGIAKTWARPLGDPIPQEVGLDTSTTDLDPAEFVDNLENKLAGDEPFVIGFSEERTFDRLEETSIGVVIESEISGIQNTIDVPVTVIEKKGSVFVHHVDKAGKTLEDSEEVIGIIGEPYETKPHEIPNYQLVAEPDNAAGVFSEEVIEVTYVYEITPVKPVDPIDPDKEVDPENPPVLPENQGLLSIDFISQFNFGEQVISVQDKTYYAQPQRLLNEDGTVNENEERPNYVQISDRRSENDRNGWTLAVTQKEQFHGAENQVLNGASLSLLNQQLITTQGGTAPGLQSVPYTLVPGNQRTLLHAQVTEGTGTWIYRFGDGETAGESVTLDVPRGANPESTTYSSTLIWELSAVPGN